jgi:hypothetical protein
MQNSSYSELSKVPWISIGHSGTNNLVSELVYHFPNKILCAFKIDLFDNGFRLCESPLWVLPD